MGLSDVVCLGQSLLASLCKLFFIAWFERAPVRTMFEGLESELSPLGQPCRISPAFPQTPPSLLEERESCMPILDLTPDELLSTTRAVRRRLDLTRPGPA